MKLNRMEIFLMFGAYASIIVGMTPLFFVRLTNESFAVFLFATALGMANFLFLIVSLLVIRRKLQLLGVKA